MNPSRPSVVCLMLSRGPSGPFSVDVTVGGTVSECQLCTICPSKAHAGELSLAEPKVDT